MNILEPPSQLKKCSSKTGYVGRNGYCQSPEGDTGVHTVCSRMSNDFLDFTKSQGNDLYSVVKPGENWCLCQSRWNDAYMTNPQIAPFVIEEATNQKTNSEIIKNIKIRNKMKI